MPRTLGMPFPVISGPKLRRLTTSAELAELSHVISYVSIALFGDLAAACITALGTKNAYGEFIRWGPHQSGRSDVVADPREWLHRRGESSVEVMPHLGKIAAEAILSS